ncbi:hypothetical protein WA158_006347 [Blastocystis sp. Blastoise]
MDLMDEIQDYELEHEFTTNDIEEKPLFPEDLHRKLTDRTTEFLVGFSRLTCETIIQDVNNSYFIAIHHFKGERKGALQANESIYLSLVYLKRCCTFNEIASTLKQKSNVVRTAILKGTEAISKCFVPFDTTLGCPKLETKLNTSEKGHLTDEAKNSRYIIDGRHQRIAALSSSKAQRRKYYSHKFNNTGLNCQYIINHEGLCVYLSPSMPASNSDISMFRCFKTTIMAGLNELMTNVGDSLSPVYILGDKGYHSESDSELLSLKNGQNDITFNRYRILIENYFGRMIKVFRAAKEPFPLSEEKYDVFNRAIAHLTNIHIKNSPLRAEEFKILQFSYDKIEKYHKEKAERHKIAQRNYQARIQNMS